MSSNHSARHTARSDTQAISINALPDEVFAFVADPHNLPQWAVGFCRSIRRDENNRWLVTTPSAEIPISFDCRAEARTIDFYFTPAPGLEAAAFSRVMPNGAGCEYVFTQFQVDGMSGDAFDAQVQALVEELHVLRGLIHARAACRPQFAPERP
jgi:hypothetical protein